VDPKSQSIRQLKVVKRSLEAGIIDTSFAGQMLRAIRFNFRKSSVLNWGKYYFPDKFDKAFCPDLHNYLVDNMHTSQTATLAPRGHAKTTISCFLIPTYLALNFPEKYQHFLNVQSTTSKAINVNVTIKEEFENNEKLIADYGEIVGPGKWTEKQFVLANGVIFSAIGAGESVRGIHYKNKRPDYMVIDDLYDDEDAYNIERIKKKERWFWASLYKAMSTSKQSVIHIQGTAIHRLDLMHRLALQKNWHTKKFQAVTDWVKEVVLWPENNTFKTLMTDRAQMGAIAFDREMQNECRSDAESKVKMEHIRYFDGAIPDEEDLEWLWCGIDPAIGEKSHNDFTGKVWVAKTSYENYYVLGAENCKMSFHKNLEHTMRLYDTYQFDLVKIESISAFKLYGDELRRTTGIPVRLITAVKDKLSRLEKQSAKFENGKVFISTDIDRETREELVEQITNNNPPHDDLRDALLLCLEDDKGRLGIGVS